MKDSSLNRWMWLLGLAVAVLVFVGFGPLGGNSPKENASGLTVAHWYNTHVGQSWASIYVVGLALFVLLVYVTMLRSVLRDTSGQRLWPNVVFGAGMLLVAGIIVAGAFQITIILAAHNDQFAIAKTVNFVSQNDELLFIAGMCFLTLSTGLGILLNRQGAPLPKLLGWYSLLVGVLSAAGPLAFIALLFGLPIWLVATGIVIAVKSRRGTLAFSDGASPGISTQSIHDAEPVTT